MYSSCASCPGDEWDKCGGGTDLEDIRTRHYALMQHILYNEESSVHVCTSTFIKRIANHKLIVCTCIVHILAVTKSPLLHHVCLVDPITNFDLR